MSLKRQKLRDKFSTFLRIQAAQAHDYVWIVDVKLRRSIDAVLTLEKYSDAIEEEIVRSFLTSLRNPDQRIVQISRSHLVAYLQETCFFVSQKLCINMGKKDALRDAFGFANETICRLGFLENYTPTKKAKLSTYAGRAIRNKLLDLLTSSDGRSDWGEFYHLSTKELKENLLLINFPSRRNEEDYVYIHKFYKQICLPSGTNETRTEPTSEHLQSICDLYNSTVSKTKENFVAIVPKVVLAIMEQCIKSIRNTEQNLGNLASLDQPVKGGNYDDESSILMDKISEHSDSSDDGESELSELERLQSELVNIVDQEITSLNTEQELIFILLYGFGCKTIKTGKILGVNQGTISRHHREKFYNPIFDKCANFCKQQVNSLCISDPEWGETLKEWLKKSLNSSCRFRLFGLLDALVKSHLQNEEQLLHQFQNSTEWIIAMGETPISITVGLVVNYIRREFKVNQSCEPIIPEITEFIIAWLHDRPTN